MCGIYGWIQLHGKTDIHTAAQVFEPMNAAITHRGPDDHGAIVFDNAVLGMTRLSIIDLDGGQQPITNEMEDCWLVFNGEIYNFVELRQELKNLGHRFRSCSDTEVILRAYEEWGADCVARLQGMFAFAIYDRRKDRKRRDGNLNAHPRLFLARDRLGKKPLYYYQDEERLIFGSEIKALLAHPAVPARVNRPMIPLYLTYGYVPSPGTFFEDICELPPGHTLTAADGDVAIRRYWEVPRDLGSETVLSENDYLRLVRDHFEDAVKVRLTSDVPLGAFLHGGVDCAAVVAVMSQLLDHPVNTFAIGFSDDPSFNELRYARIVADCFKTNHREFLVKPDAIDLLPKLVWHYDQPFADTSAISTYCLAQLTREHVKVTLTGDGVDELFVGYDCFAAARIAKYYRLVPGLLRNTVHRWVHALPESTSYNGLVRLVRQFVDNAALPLPERYLEWVGIFRPSFLNELMIEATAIDPADHFRGYFDHRQDADPIGQLLAVNMMSYLPGDLLVKTDRMTMANSLEARCPFLDHRLLEFACQIPSALKLKGMTTHYVLKRALKGLVPDEIIWRKKHGFGVPVGRWFRTSMRDYVRDTLLSPEAMGRGYFRPEALRLIVEEHISGRRDHGHRLWALLTFEVWHQLFIDREVSSWMAMSENTKSQFYLSSGP
jgi:asparagine synthase (glutamine-hydrolysing)